MDKQEQNTNNTALKGLNGLSTVLFYFTILFFVIAFNFRDTPTSSGWYQQFMPNNLPNFQISDMFFLDSLTGWAVTGNSNPNDTSGYILKTTNGGDNWTLKFTDVRDFSRVKFINSNTGFVSGGYNTGAKLYKSTDGGNNWFTLFSPSLIYFDDMSVLNNDTIWLVDHFALEGGVFRTTDSGVSWQTQYSQSNNNPSHIYMFNARIGFMDGGAQLRRTTDGGFNWIPITGEGSSFTDMFFVDSLTGWKSGPMKKTTNGGLNWVTQTMPTGGNISGSGIGRFSNINKDTIWGCGGYLFYPGQGPRVFLHRTTNGGDTWYLQVPDTSYQIPSLSFIDFTDKLKGWSYMVSPRGIHTITGGDTTFLTGIRQISNEVPKEYKLFQNYPNPFNPSTNIKYQIANNKFVRLIVYDILGKVVAELVNEQQKPGTYQIDFTGTGLSSSIYFYSLLIDGIIIDTRKMILLK